MLIRDIQRDDLAECSALYARVFSAPPWNEPWTADNAHKRLSHFFNSAGSIGLLGKEDNILGFVLGNSEPYQNNTWFYLREMCTDMDFQNRGIGGRILHTLEEKLNSTSIQNIYLATNKHIPAANFYVKNGFNHESEMGFYSKHVKEPLNKSWTAAP